MSTAIRHAKLEKQSKEYSDLLDVSQGVVRDLRASNAKLTAERDALSAQLRAAREQEPAADVNPYLPGTPQHTAYEIGANGMKHNAQASAQGDKT